jgi:hypothetical protein
MLISNMCVYLQPSIYPRTAAASLYLTMFGCGPLQALLEGALGHQAACQLCFHFQEEIKGRWCEICEKWSWENIFTPFSTASY